MPTHDRRHFVPRAVEYFRRQHYPNRELVVVDDADDGVADLLPADPRIRHVRLPRRTVLGAKRNIACRLARGAFIAHWDDDDWYSDHRLDLQVGELLARAADLCGASSLYFLDPAARAAWRFRHTSRLPWFAGTSLCYRRTVWSSRLFDERAAGEDNHFVLGAAGRAVVDVGGSNCVVAVLHAANTSSAPGRDRRWTRVPVAEVEEVMGADSAFYRPSRSADGGIDAHRIVTAASPVRTGCPT
jgi:glycosyltransferase involved in cell wall biosynthesis